MQQWLEINQKYTDEHESCNTLAHLYLRMGCFAEAHEYTNALSEIHGLVAEAHEIRGNIYLKQELWVQAIESLTEALAVKPSENIELGLILGLLKSNQLDLATQKLEGGLQKNPDCVKRLSLKQLVLQRKQDWEGSLQVLDRLIELQGANAKLLTDKCDLLYKLKQLDESEALCEQLLKESSDNKVLTLYARISQVRFNRIQFAAKPDKSISFDRRSKEGAASYDIYIETVARWDKLLADNPQNELALFHLAENSLMAGEYESTERYLDKLKNVPDRSIDERLYSLNAKLALLVGDSKAALRYWEKAVANGMRNGQVMNKMVNLFLSVDNVESARACLNICGDKLVESDLGQLGLAKCYIQELKWSEAIEILECLDRFTERRKLAAELLYRCYMSDFQYENASTLCETLDESEHPEKYYLLGKAQYKQLLFVDAADSFNNAITTIKHADSNVWLIRALYAMSEYDSAVAKAERVDSMDDIDSLTQGRCWEAAGMISTAEKHYKRAAKENGDTESWFALVKFNYALRHWGRAYAAIVEAETRNAANTEMQAIKQEITSALIASGTAIPESSDQLANFEFNSSEAMVTSIVDRILARAKAVSSNGAVSVSRKNARISLIINSLGSGGAERQAVNLANGLVADSSDEIFLECTHLSRKVEDCFYLSQLDDKVNVREYYDRSVMLSPYDIPELVDFADLIEHIQPVSRQQYILHMAKRLIETKPDVVHGWLDETFINTALVGSMLGIKKIVGRWGSMPPGVSRTITQREESNIEYLQHAYGEIARIPELCYSSNSRSTGDSYAELMGIHPDSVNIVYNGIDEEKLSCDAAGTTNLREELGIPESAVVIGTVFRISEEKRPILWVDIAKHLLKLQPDMHFIVVGAGPLECQLAEYISKHDLTNVHLVGRQENVGAWLNLFDVLLMTSRVEGVSNSVIEAQFAACPVVVPNVGGLSEAMEHGRTGCLLEDHSVEAFADAILSVVSDSKHHKQLASNAQSFARQKFSIPSMVSNYRALFFDNESLVRECA
ncbi:MAG: glycosyltransferase [Granulosicoccus sp.]